MKLVIVGGVAGGAASAARARRLDEKAEIILFERGPYVSFANCGLPYYAGEVIKDRARLLVQTPEALHTRFNLDVRVNQEVLSIDRQAHTVTVRNLETDEEYTESYDKLILSPGASPFIPPIPGADLPCVYSVRTVPDIDKVKEKLDSGTVKNALVVGGGFIGIEMAENLIHRGITTSLVEMLDQVMASFDPEMANILHQELTAKGVNLYLSTRMTAIEERGDSYIVRTQDEAELPADMVIMAVGVRPETELAEKAGLTVGKKGIQVNAQMATSDPDIFAMGDAAEMPCPIMDTPKLVPLAGPAAKQARVAVNTIFGKPDSYDGSIGTAIVKVFDLTAAAVGIPEQLLKLTNRNYEKIYTHPANHAGYYPGTSQLSMKVMFDPDKGTVLGAQVIGRDGADKRIDVLAVAVKHRLTVRDLAEFELAYAPPFGSAKDAVNLIGMAASNHIDGLSPLTHWDKLDKDGFLLDVRTPDEVEAGSVPGAASIPVDELRNRLDEIPKDKPIQVFCRVGIRAHAAVRILKGNGFDAYNVSGGYLSYCNRNDGDIMENKPCNPPARSTNDSARTVTAGKPGKEHTMDIVKELDLCGLQCPGPIIQIRQTMDTLESGQSIKVKAGDPGFARDLPKWCESTGNTLESLTDAGNEITAVITKSSGQSPGNPAAGNGTTIVAFSDDLDKAYASLIIARGAAAAGRPVTMFFTFWGLNLLRKTPAPSVKKGLLSRMFGWMMPSSAAKAKLSKMHMGGMGTAMMKHVMKSKKVESLPDMLKNAVDEGVRLVACTMTMDVMGIDRSELLDCADLGGVAAYIGDARLGGHNLFI